MWRMLRVAIYSFRADVKIKSVCFRALYGLYKEMYSSDQNRSTPYAAHNPPSS